MTTINNDDIKDIINDTKELRKYLVNKVNDHNEIIIKNVDSNTRNLIYRQMYKPLDFEKIKNEENIDNSIKIFNINNEKNNEENTEDNVTDPTYSEGINEESNESIEEDESYTEDYEERLDKLENMLSIMIKQNDIYTKKIMYRINMLLSINIIGWSWLILLTPTKVSITY